MRFGPLPVGELEGAILAHTLHLDDGPLVKGRIVSADDVQRLIRDGIEHVTAARLDPGDLHENPAAERVATSVLGAGLRLGRVATGRANVFATNDGVLDVDVARLGRLNQTVEALTLATLTSGTRVRAGDLVATAKVIPLAVAGAAVEAWERAARGERVLRLAAFRPRSVGLVLTRWARTPERVLERAAAVLGARVEACGSRLDEVATVEHAADAVARALAGQRAAGCSLLLVLGASQCADRDDAVPAAIDLLGGTVLRFGIPVDPGNLLLWADVEGTTTLGVPGCARSPKASGFDTVLERVLADLPLDLDFLTGLGHGGLRKEVPERGRPRLEGATEIGKESVGEGNPLRPRPAPRVGAILLAAGASRRMGTSNKLLETVGGEPMARRAAAVLLEAGLDPVVVVTGHESGAVAKAMDGLPVHIVVNPCYEEGMSTSLIAGLDELTARRAKGAPEIEGALVALADMPWVRAPDVRALATAFAPLGRSGVCVPVRDRKRGNPVLWGADHFPALRTLAGDEGARSLLGDVSDRVVEVPIGHDGILRDVDTPEALAALRQSDPAHSGTE